MGADLQALLETFTPVLTADARDAALLALGWVHCADRSSSASIGIARGSNDSVGSVSVEEGRGLVIRLVTSKGPQTEAVEIVVPRDDMPSACTALEHWDPTMRAREKK